MCINSYDYFEGNQGIIPARLFDTSQTTAAYLHQRVLQVLEEYFSTLGRVAEQCQVKHYRDRLDQGTFAARVFLQPLNIDLPVLLYFDKTTGIRNYPFTSAAFVGTPYQSAVEDDWMSIPHEIGHYLYWNLGKDPAGNLTLGNLADSLRWQEELRACADSAASSGATAAEQSLKRMFHSWLEEIFADVVGTHLGGEPFVKSLETRIERFAGGEDDLKLDDGEHPPLCLRPVVRTHTLELKNHNSAINFDTFFEQTFNGLDVPGLKLQGTLSPHEEHQPALAAADQAVAVAEPPALPMEVRQIIPALQQLVDGLYTEIKDVIDKLPSPASNQTTAFARMLDRANELAPHNRKWPYENLLEPIILEGSIYHSHWAVGHYQSHWVSGHNH